MLAKWLWWADALAQQPTNIARPFALEIQALAIFDRLGVGPAAQILRKKTRDNPLGLTRREAELGVPSRAEAVALTHRSPPQEVTDPD